MEPSRRVREECERRAGDRCSLLEFARGELQRARARASSAAGTEATSAHLARASRLDTIPDFLLPRIMGILPQPAAAGCVGRRRIRGGDRFIAGERLAQLRRAPRSGRNGGRGAHFDALLPPVSVQRQPVWNRCGDFLGERVAGKAAAAHIPVSFYPWDDRLDYLAEQERADRAANQARAGASLRGRSWRIFV